MRWGAYFAVVAAVISIGLALGLTLPLVSLRLAAWGYGSFAIGVMAAIPAVGVLLGAVITTRLAAYWGTARLMQGMLLMAGCSVVLLAWIPSYPVWLVLRLLIGIALTVVFILGESWINQLAVEEWRGRLVAFYGTGYALSQLSGPLLLSTIGSQGNQGFWWATTLLLVAVLLLQGRSGAPAMDARHNNSCGLRVFCRRLPSIAWAILLFAAFESMILTLLPVYALQQGFSEARALWVVTAVVVGDALLQLPLGWLADRLPRTRIFVGCGALLVISCALIPLAMPTVAVWPLLVLFGASAGGLFTLSLILIGEQFRDAALIRANTHVAQLWGIGCLLGPLTTGAASQWLTGHALPLLLGLGALVFLYLVRRFPPFAAPLSLLP